MNFEMLTLTSTKALITAVLIMPTNFLWTQSEQVNRYAALLLIQIMKNGQPEGKRAYCFQSHLRMPTV